MHLLIFKDAFMVNWKLTKDNNYCYIIYSARDTVDHSDSLAPPTEEQVENSPKLTKNGSDRMGLHECKDSSPGDAVEEVKQVSEATDMDEDLLATTEDNNVLTSTQLVFPMLGFLFLLLYFFIL